MEYAEARLIYKKYWEERGIEAKEPSPFKSKPTELGGYELRDHNDEFICIIAGSLAIPLTK
ncbi:MAG: hypothetical protein RI580_18435 [Halothece sp. Uz-M2-17]|nr:hypothetical protein [Halothece sp. Uz-M2-17]